MSKKVFWTTNLSTTTKNKRDIKIHKKNKFKASKGQKFQKLQIEKRFKEVKEWIEQGYSYKYLATKYGVSWKTVQTWVSIYKRDGDIDISKKGGYLLLCL